MFSIWEKQSFLTADIILIGAGITGLSAAASLKEKHPQLRISVLERGILPSGASTKNAGFACFGSVSELMNDISTLGEDGMIQLVERRIAGLRKTIDRLGAQTIDLQVKGGYELLFEKNDQTLSHIDRVNQLLFHQYQGDIYQLSDQKISGFGFGNTCHLIENKYEGQLDTGKLIASLWDYCSNLGIKVYTSAEVLDYEETSNGVDIACKGASFKAQKVGLCTNAFSKRFIEKDLDLKPGRGMVMSIETEKPLKINGTFHYDGGYYYFRDYYGKLIFGGGRNHALEDEETTDFGINQEIKAKLLKDLENLVLPNQKFTISSEWSGIMAFGQNKNPIVEKISENISIGVRLGGMGVAIGSLVGEELAKIIFAD